MEEIQVLVVMDSDGEMRPLAGIWKNNEQGILSSQEYLDKNKLGDSIVSATLIKNSFNEKA